MAQSIQSPATVLIVDRDANNVRLARGVLESAGFHVCDAHDAVSTFETLKSWRPDIIVLDIQLPGMDGWDLTRRLRNSLATRHIPIIAMTAFGTHADETYARVAGCAAFVDRPISAPELPAIIRRHLPPQR